MNKRSSNPFSHAVNGIWETYRGERNFKIHVFAAVIVVILGALTDITRYEWYWIILCIAIVFIMEVLNTAIEALVDLVSPEVHPLAKKAKDAAAGSVLMAVVFSVIVGGAIFLPKLWRLFFGSYVA